MGTTPIGVGKEQVGSLRKRKAATGEVTEAIVDIERTSTGQKRTMRSRPTEGIANTIGGVAEADRKAVMNISHTGRESIHLDKDLDYALAVQIAKVTIDRAAGDRSPQCSRRTRIKANNHTRKSR